MEGLREGLLVGIVNLNLGHIIMFIIGGILIYLAIKKEYEPTLLLPIGFGAILCNIPLSSAVGEDGFLTILYEAGIATELFPVLIFIAVGAMIDFKPLIASPFMLFFGAAAQFGIFATMMFALATGQFTLPEAASIGIIGAADGPTSIYVAKEFARNYLGPISVAAYSYMSLVPIIQPPVIKLLTTKKERKIRMKYTGVKVPRVVEILFPIVITIISGIIAPMSVALIGALMFGNLIRVCGVLDRLSISAQNELANLVTILLGITIGSTMTADAFLDVRTLMIMAMGLVAFIFDTAGGVIFAKILNLFLKEKVNPMIGAAGISAFPMSGRVVQKLAKEEDPTNFILMQAMSANVAGQLGSVVAGSMILALVPLFI
ncbi:sodium ion-translocating decarboxylase subunit beta [Peptoniphilus catoniae]|uniref:sodium ion-translocating decarboxylase subunit beta n=1 Tax=Peptoniphilus catoniae TaxID=1660341 RepID=UPI0010FDA505|nr:sodium ion-translocating decarboxylase subunit beta [Peptoniphilus catoniae]